MLQANFNLAGSIVWEIAVRDMLTEKKESNTIIGCLCAFGSEFLFGLSFLFSKDATNQAGVFELLGWRFFIAFVAMSICVLTGIIKISIRKENIKRLFLIALFSPVIYFIGETIGISRTSASESGVVIACVPEASMIASVIYLKKKPTKRQIGGVCITLIGVCLTVLTAGMSISLSVTGYLALLMAVLSFAVYSVLVESSDGLGGAEITYGTLTVGAVVFVIIALIQAYIHGNAVGLLALPIRDTHFLSAVLYQGVGCSIFAFFMQNVALSKIGVNRTASFIGVSTVASILSGILILGESFSIVQVIGAAVIIAGIYVANMKVTSS